MMLARFVTVLILITLLIVSCAPEVSDEQIFSQLENLSDEEFDAVLAEDNAALAGKALAYRFSKESSDKVRMVRQQAKALTWLSCSSTANGVNVKYSYERVNSRAFANICSGYQLQEYSCAGNRYVQKTIACENGCMGGKCLAGSPKFTPVTNGLVGWWDGDEIVSNIASDLVNNNDGVLFNGITTASGKIGQAFSFDGQDDYVNIFFPNYLSEFTIEAWVYLELFEASGLDVPTGPEVLTIMAQDGPARWSLTHEISTSNLFFRYNDGGDANIVAAFGSTPQSISPPGTPFIVPKVWRHVAVTYKSGLADVYIDGVKTNQIGINKISLSPTSGFQPIIKIGDGVIVDSNDLTDKPANWAGLIDEVQIYNRILSQAEIQSIYNYQPLPALKPEAVQIAVIQK